MNTNKYKYPGLSTIKVPSHKRKINQVTTVTLTKA